MKWSRHDYPHGPHYRAQLSTWRLDMWQEKEGHFILIFQSVGSIRLDADDVEGAKKECCERVASYLRDCLRQVEP